MTVAVKSSRCASWSMSYGLTFSPLVYPCTFQGVYSGTHTWASSLDILFAPLSAANFSSSASVISLAILAASGE